MKTTIEIPDPLFKQARRYAEARRITMKAVVEQGLRAVLAESREPATFKLADGSVGGNGLSPEFREAGWDILSEAIYPGIRE